MFLLWKVATVFLFEAAYAFGDASGPICPAVDGPQPVYFPHNDCTKFWQCSNGIPYLMECRDELYFNPKLNVCDWPQNVGCQSSKTTNIMQTEGNTEVTNTVTTKITNITSATDSIEYQTTERTPTVFSPTTTTGEYVTSTESIVSSSISKEVTEIRTSEETSNSKEFSTETIPSETKTTIKTISTQDYTKISTVTTSENVATVTPTLSDGEQNDPTTETITDFTTDIVLTDLTRKTTKNIDTSSKNTENITSVQFTTVTTEITELPISESSTVGSDDITEITQNTNEFTTKLIESSIATIETDKTETEQDNLTTETTNSETEVYLNDTTTVYEVTSSISEENTSYTSEIEVTTKFTATKTTFEDNPEAVTSSVVQISSIETSVSQEVPSTEPNEISSSTTYLPTTEEDISYICAEIPDTYFLAPHPSDCKKYIVCDYGIAIVENCPFEEWFNAVQHVCSRPEVTVCGGILYKTYLAGIKFVN